VEIMGHNTGWLTLGAGVAGGADVILIPEIPYSVEKVAEAVLRRSYAGKRFSIIALAEGSASQDDLDAWKEAKKAKKKAKKKGKKKKLKKAKKRLKQLKEERLESVSVRLSRQLEELTGLESRLTSLGHLQRGGTPSPTDRLLGTRLGTACAELIDAGRYGVMVAVRGDECVPVELKEVAGKRKEVPLDHPWIQSARLVGTSFGD
jgi:6-phosphofructokinase 1